MCGLGVPVGNVLRVLRGFRDLRAGKRQAWTPRRSHWCVALGCLLARGGACQGNVSAMAFRAGKRVEGLANGRLGPRVRVVKVLRVYGLRAGKRQAWTPIRSHWCVALGVPVGNVLIRVLRVFRGFRGLRAGKRQAWTPIRSHWCVALGCLLETF